MGDVAIAGDLVLRIDYYETILQVHGEDARGLA
jgi:hypothetical protein